MKSEAEYFVFVGEPVPTCSHQLKPQVGTQKFNENKRVPTVPTVPTKRRGKEVIAALLDRGAFEERAAIAEHDGELSRRDAETLAAREQGFSGADDLHRAKVDLWASEIDRLAALGPVSPQGAEALMRARMFISEGWALQAVRLGWDELDLFGVCPRAPWERMDRKGAAFRGAVQAVTRDAVVYVGGFRCYRISISDEGGTVPIWILAAGIVTEQTP